jgi:hypothetical protein
MPLPDWALKFREPKTEIKFIGNGYYKYAVEYRYNPSKKRTDKVTGILLGKITEQDGFIVSDKHQIRSMMVDAQIDIRNYGVYKLFSNLLEDEMNALRLLFPAKDCELLFCFAMYRWAHNSPIKRVPEYYRRDFCTQEFGFATVSDKAISATLKFFGEQRARVVQWMSSLLGQTAQQFAQYVMMDSTHVQSKSDLMGINARGYNPDFNFDKQIRLMYLFSAQRQSPVYYRLINGNIPDSKSMALCLEEMNMKNVIYIADKGFYSKQNTARMKELGLQYIVPLQRNNKLIDYKPLKKADFKKKLNYFIYNKRVIWCYTYQIDGEPLITFLDESLRAREEADYAERVGSHPESHTKEKFLSKLTAFGTLTFTYQTETEKNFEEIYCAYKQRNEIETMFDSYKNFLSADAMHMQDRYVTEGWLLANFLAMRAYQKLFIRLKEKNKLNKYSPKDIIEISKSIHKMKINEKWKLSEMSKKTQQLFKDIQIDYLNERS